MHGHRRLQQDSVRGMLGGAPLEHAQGGAGSSAPGRVAMIFSIPSPERLDGGGVGARSLLEVRAGALEAIEPRPRRRSAQQRICPLRVLGEGQGGFPAGRHVAPQPDPAIARQGRHPRIHRVRDANEPGSLPGPPGNPGRWPWPGRANTSQAPGRVPCERGWRTSARAVEQGFLDLRGVDPGGPGEHLPVQRGHVG